MPTPRKPAANRVATVPGVSARVVNAPTIPFDPVNVHPADELAELREKIKTMQARADSLRDRLLEDGADLKGDNYTATITPGVRETLDRKAITEAYGEKAIEPFLKKTSFQTVKLEEN
jgi:hypothetical protein